MQHYPYQCRRGQTEEGQADHLLVVEVEDRTARIQYVGYGQYKEIKDVAARDVSKGNIEIPHAEERYGRGYL